MATTPSGGDKKNIVKMAYIYFQEGRWDKAIEEYKKLLIMDPDDVNTHNMLGDVYAKKGSLREAYEQYQKVATDLVSKGQSDKAAVVHKKIAALDPTTLPPDARTKQNLIKQSLKAEAAMEQGDFQSAIEAFSEVLKLDPENISAYGKLAELLVSQGKIPEAVQQFAVLGTAFLKNRLYKKAQEAFMKIVELDPNQVEARINLAQIYIKQGSESDAKKEYLTVAEIFMQQGDLDRAQQYSQKAIEFKSIEAHYVLGQALFRKRQFAEAKVEFENLLRFKVGHVGALIHLGQVYLELNQLDKAAEQFGKAQKGEKDNPKVLEALAELAVRKGAKTDASAYFIQASEWYLSKKDHKRALETARKAETVDPESPMVLRAVGLALKDEGKKPEAIEILSRARDIFEQQGNSIEAATVQHQLQLLGAGVSATAGKVPDLPAPAGHSSGDQVLDLEEEAAPVAAEAVQTDEVIEGTLPSVESEVVEEAAEPAPMEVENVPEEILENTEAVLEETPEMTDPEAPVVAEASVSAEPVEELYAQDAAETELASQLEIASNYVRQNLVEEAIEIYQQLLETYPDHAEVRAKLNEAYTLYVKGGEEVLGALEAEKQAKEAEDKRLREEVERRTREENERKSRAENEKKTRENVEEKVRAEMERKLREEMEKKVRGEMEKKAKDDAERKAKEEAEKKSRGDIEKKMREESERKIRDELEKKSRDESERKRLEDVERKARQDAENKLREEMEKSAHDRADHRSREDSERKLREEMERKIREETEQKVRGEVERKVREEMERKARETGERGSRSASEAAPKDDTQRRSKEEADRMAREILERADRAAAERRAASEKKSSPARAVPKSEGSSDESRDDFMTIAVADIYVRQGLYEEARKIYQRITDMEPDNYEAKKKLTDLENLMKSKGLQKPSSGPPASAAPPPRIEPVPPAPHPDKDSVAKKKHGKVGYV